MSSIRGHINYGVVKPEKPKIPSEKKNEVNLTDSIKAGFIVVRFSHMDDVDVIKSIEEVIKKRGYCWFGKYGQAIATESIRRLTKGGKITLYAMLVRKHKHKGKNHQSISAHQFECKEISQKQPPQGTYPEYYDRFGHRISSWLKLETSNINQVQLEDVITVSSGESVTHSLSSSIRGHFFCYLRARDKK